MSRKTRSDKINFSEKDIKKIETMSAMGLSLQQISSIFGVSTEAIYRRAKEGNDNLSVTLMRGKTKALYKVANKAYKLAVEGNPSMIKYFLSCRGGWSEKSQITIDQVENNEDKAKSNFKDSLKRMTREELKEVKKLNSRISEIIENTKGREVRPTLGWNGEKVYN